MEMLNLYEVNKFYDSKRKGFCGFVDKYGSCMGKVCGQKTNKDSMFCDDHEQEGVDRERAITFLRNLTANPTLLDKILSQISYYSLHHLDGAKPCEKINCDDCDNDDREFDSRSNITSSLCKIMSNSQIPSVQMPSVQMPSVQMPSVQMPSVQMPSVQMPSVPKSPMLPTISEDVVFRAVPTLPKISEDVVFRPQNTKAEQPEIQVEPYGDGLYRDVNTGFILVQDGLIYLDVDETEKYLQRKITQEDRRQALNLGLQIKSNNFIPSVSI